MHYCRKLLFNYNNILLKQSNIFSFQRFNLQNMLFFTMQYNKKFENNIRLEPFGKNVTFKSQNNILVQTLCTSKPLLLKKERVESTSLTNTDEVKIDEFKNLTLFAKFKKMYKEYWYVLVPVHLVTSSIWLGSFYYLSTSGFDIVGLLQSWNFDDKIIKPFKDSSMGHVAIAYLLYKIATPARYFITIGATTLSIKYLVRLGVIKPVPTRTQLVQMYKDRKEIVQKKLEEKKV